jgi:hypothetical protein
MVPLGIWFLCCFGFGFGLNLDLSLGLGSGLDLDLDWGVKLINFLKA